jgi:hypothetical protein
MMASSLRSKGEGSSLGPRPYSFVTSIYHVISRISCWPRTTVSSLHDQC